MANKVVNLTISLKDGISSKLKGIGRGIKALSSGFMKMAKIGMWAGGAVAAGLGAVAKAYSDQESVDRKMKAAFDAVGESGTKAVATWGAWATAIQRATSLGDEEVMSTITLAKIMGVQNDKLADATKGAIGLSKAFGIDLNSSMKMVALAFQGEYTMLQRYIPALRAAKTDSEKMAVVQAAMANGFKLAEAELGTISGEFKALKGVFWDAMQEFGKVLFGDGGLAKGLALVKEKIIELVEGGTITRWAEQAKAGLDAVIQTIKILTSSGEGRSQVLQAIGKVLAEAFKVAATGALNVLLKGAPMVGLAIGRGVMEVLGIAVTPRSIKKKETQASKLEDKAKWLSGFAKGEGGLAGYEKVYQKEALEASKQAAQLRREIEGFWSGKMEIASTSGLKDSLGSLKDVINEFSEGISISESSSKLTDAAETSGESLKAATIDAAKKITEAAEEKAPEAIESIAEEIGKSLESNPIADAIKKSNENFGITNDDSFSGISGGGWQSMDAAGLGALASQISTGIGPRSEENALKKVVEMLMIKPEEITEAMSEAMTDVFDSETVMVENESAKSLLDQQKEILKSMYALQTSRLGGVLN